MRYYLAFIAWLITKVERWEVRKSYGSTGIYNDLRLAGKSPALLPLTGLALVAILFVFIGLPLLDVAFIISKLPIPENAQTILVFLLLLCLVVGTFRAIFKLRRKR